MGPHRLPARTRILAAAAAAITVHMLFSRGVEGARIRVLTATPALGGPGGILAEPGEAATDPALSARVAAWRTARARALGAAGRVAVPVLEWRADRKVAIIGAGAESGLRPLDPVVVPAGLLGFVETVQAHLARVKLLGAPKARVAVTLADSRPGLPGELSALNAVLEGSGDGARLVEGPLLTEFRVGDRLDAVLDATEGAASRGLPVGEVTEAGLAPSVRLFAGPADLGLVAVASGRKLPALFTMRVLSVEAAPLVGGAGALLEGAEGAEGAPVAPGCAVLAQGRYLGRVVSVAGRGLVASRLADRGHRMFVRTLGGADRTWTGELVALGEGRFRLEGTGGPDPADQSVIALTAGGEGLVPADLPAGVLERDGGEWRLRSRDAAWPRQVEVPVFAFGDELAQLLPR